MPTRDPSHFAALARLLDLERQEERARMETSRRTLPLSELEALGLVLLDLESREESVGLGGRCLITFAHAEKHALPHRPSPGDLVTVSPRKAEVDDPPRGTVASATRREVTVAFEKPPPPWVEEGRLRLDLVSNDVTWERARSALTRMAAMDKGKVRDRREVVLGNLAPRFDHEKPFDASRPLNPEQMAAVQLALSAQDFALVHGPPGTGKSTVLAEIAVQVVRRGQRLLCTAASNAAVDHLLELCLDAGLRAVRIGHPARVLPHLQEHTLDLLVEAHPDRVLARSLFEEAFDLQGYASKQRQRGRSRERFANAREAQAEARKLIDEARRLERRATASVLGGADVLCATLSMLDGWVLESQSFDVALFDEATQATEPLSLLAFLKAPTVILAGDPQQLPPTVVSLEAQKQGLGVSLFERLLADHGESVKRLLLEQHRMNEALMRFPSQEMYGGQLRAHPAVAGWTLPGEPPLVFLDTAGKGFDEAQGDGTASLHNDGEADLVVAHARALLARGLSPRELAVVTPYRAQAQALRERLQDVPEVEVDTIDAFQGREKDAILLSLVRSNTEQALGFLLDLRRMNVALTRARKHLFVVGDSATLSGNHFYERFVEMTQATGAYRSAWEWTEQ